jgi:K+-sensing histidine kinase KdpD
MTNSQSSQQEFPAILASSVHDIKNSLATVHELIMQIAKKQQNTNNRDLIQLEFEANRMNNCLIQLLELYKIDSAKFCLDIEEHQICDIFQEIKAQQTPLLELNNINLNIECSENLLCYCDYHHICNALGSILNNAQRYTNTQILLSAYQDESYTIITMEDDGAGYPHHLLSIDPADHNTRTDWLSGSTGLGLYFVSTIATLHIAQNRNGFIKIDNGSCVGGARFRLFLP